MNAATAVRDVETAWAAASSVPDPEVPVLTVADLGVLRDVRVSDDGSVDVDITPTYSGCPAMHTIEHDIVESLRSKGFQDIRVHTTLTPAWTTDWMTDDGRRKLAEYGIAPPGRRAMGGPVPLTLGVRPATVDRLTCPQCGSADVRELSHFGSTACKSLWQCAACHEPFDHFKAI